MKSLSYDLTWFFFVCYIFWKTTYVLGENSITDILGNAVIDCYLAKWYTKERHVTMSSLLPGAFRGHHSESFVSISPNP